MSDARAREPRPIDVRGEIEIDAAGTPVTLRGDGDRLVLEAPSIRAARALSDSIPSPRLSERRVQTLRSFFSRADVSIELRVRGVRIATLDAQGESNLLGRAIARRLGVMPLKASAVGLLRRGFG